MLFFRRNISRSFQFTVNIFVVCLGLLVPGSCLDEEENVYHGAELERISVYISKTINYTLDFNYETPNRISVDFTGTMEEFKIRENIILIYDDTMRLISEQITSLNGSTSTNTYSYSENIVFLERSYSDTVGNFNVITDTIKLDITGKPIQYGTRHYTWENNNLVSEYMDQNYISCFRPSNQGGVYISMYYTPMSNTYKYDDYINPFAFMKLPPNSYLLYLSYELYNALSSSGNNIIEADLREESPAGDCSTKHVMTSSVKYSIRYDQYGYPTKITVKKDDLPKDQPDPEIHFEYLH